MKKLFLLALVTLLFSCENNNIAIDADNLLIGNWINPEYDNEITIYKRGKSLPEKAYGISFLPSGNFIERTSGFCGTPPLSFYNEEGTFTLKDELITISSNSYLSQHTLRIVSISETDLVIKRELTIQEIEHRALMDLYDKIYNIAYNQTCANDNDWTFTAYGSKACGGPQGYVPYSKKIDTVDFLKKVENYTNAEKAFNIKWAIISDCALINPPKSITCNNGYASLNY